jgi:hypothetical protein
MNNIRWVIYYSVDSQGQIEPIFHVLAKKKQKRSKWSSTFDLFKLRSAQSAPESQQSTYGVLLRTTYSVVLRTLGSVGPLQVEFDIRPVQVLL